MESECKPGQRAPWSRTISALFLVGGSCIGGGMLALPVATGIAGFVPSLAMMAICWFAMTATALFLLEVSLWMEEGAHVVTMTTRLLGPVAKVTSWILYLFIAYASLVAYTAGAGAQLAQAFKYYFGLTLSKAESSTLFVVIFVGVIYLGSQIVGRVNSWLFIAMIVAYVALVGMGIDEITPSNLLHMEWTGSIWAVPLLLTAFSFQTMVPSLTPYLHRDARALRIAIIGGTGLSFLVYIIWQALILGIVPVEGSNGLKQALLLGEPATVFLNEHVHGIWVVAIAEYFAFFAIVTSFLGIGMGLFDFLRDGLKLPDQGWGKIWIGLLMALPIWFVATYYDRIFLLALDATGGYGDTILNGIFPVMMVWIGRYRLGYVNDFRVGGGRPLLLFVGLFFTAALLLEIFLHLGVVPSIYEAYDLLLIPNAEELMEEP